MNTDENRRILLIDDSPSIHDDFRKILGTEGEVSSALEEAKAAFLGEDSDDGEAVACEFEIDSAFQGQEGLEFVLESMREEKPYAVAFVDVRMPPGWDGVQTIKQLWKVDSELQVVICTAFSDYSWSETVAELGRSDRLLILKKPFDTVEIRQLAHALTDKWNTAHREQLLVGELRRAEAEARAYAASLETVNRALQTAMAKADRVAEMKSEFMVQLSGQLNGNLGTIVQALEEQGAQGDLERELEEALEKSQNLICSLNEFLEISLVESGDLALESAPFSIVELVREVVAELRPLADAKGLELTAEFPAAVPEAIRNDAGRLRQVLTELVENAIENTATGHVRVTAAMDQTRKWESAVLRCDVADTGSGIPSELHGRLFEPFAGGGQAPAAAHPGLGLALAKHLAGLMGGDLVYEHTPGEGSTFSLFVEAGDLGGVKMVEQR